MRYFWVTSLLRLRGFNHKRAFFKSLCFIVIATGLFVLIFDPHPYNVAGPIPDKPQAVKRLDFISGSNNTTVDSNGQDPGKKSIISGYTGYTIQRLGLKPLTSNFYLGKANLQYPVFNDVLSFHYPIDIDKTNKLKCRYWKNQSSEDSVLRVNRTLLIVVISAAEHWARRDMIRQTWGGQSRLEADWIQMIFLIGSTVHEDKALKEQLDKEKVLHGDLVQTNVVDTYANLTLKSLAMLYWSYTRCPAAQLVLKCDDDIYLNLNGLLEVLSEQQFQPTNLLYGLAVVKDRPQRDPSVFH